MSDGTRSRAPIQHHHNSQRFKCACGKVKHWGTQKFIVCQCGARHWKQAKNFRGEG